MVVEVPPKSLGTLNDLWFGWIIDVGNPGPDRGQGGKYLLLPPDARLRHQASVEDIDYRAARGLDRALFQKLTAGGWIDAHENLILCGPTGIGKSWLASALAHKACRDNRSVLYQRIPKLFSDLALARGDGRYARLLRALGGVQLLILDDWGLEPLDAAARHDLLEILEERYGRRSTIITSQIPVDKWHELIGDPTYADAILDRIVHNAQRINLTGHSLRRSRANKTSKEGVPT
jgi:DNA replication protein DnaC